MCATDMNSKEPLISVIMGVQYRKNDTNALKKAVLSVLNQTYSNFEFLICESGSTKEACELLDALSLADERIRLIDGSGAYMLTQKLNRCLWVARGEWIARMDDDDVSYPNRFDCQLDYLRRTKNLSGVGTWVREIGGNKNCVRKLPEEPSFDDFRVRFPFIHPTLMIRRSDLVAVGGYSESYLQVGCDDYELLARMYRMGFKFGNVPEVLFDYSIISSQIENRPYKLFWNEFRTRMKCFGEAGKLPEWIIWAIKPLIVGLIPRQLLYRLKCLKNK